MKNAAKNPTLSEALRGHAEFTRGAITWEYRFCVEEELETELAAAKWRAVSSYLRKDNRREFLLKRPRA